MTGLPAKTALLLIDLQQAVDDPSWGHRNNLEAERAIARLLAAWRASGRSVIHVQHLSTEPGSPYRPGQPGCDFKPGARPRAGEVVVQKSVQSAFVETGLAALLRDQEIAALVIVGALTSNSVEATARMAGNLGFATWVVSDATWTVDKTDLDGRLWRAEEVHALSLANLAGEYATVATTDQVLDAVALRSARVASQSPRATASRTSSIVSARTASRA